MDRGNMYCGRCKHWRFMKDGEAEGHDKNYLPPIDVTREDCAEVCSNHNSVVMKHCYLGKCDIGAVDHVLGGRSIFCDENYAEDGTCEQFDLFA